MLVRGYLWTLASNNWDFTWILRLEIYGFTIPHRNMDHEPGEKIPNILCLVPEDGVPPNSLVENVYYPLVMTSSLLWKMAHRNILNRWFTVLKKGDFP